MDFLVIMVIVGVLVVFVTGPLRRAPVMVAEPVAGAAEPQVLELEAARDAKLRELRDAELDHRTGKLSDEDFEALDATLRGEAIEILHALDSAREQAATIGGT